MIITKLGHCCLLVEHKGLRILTDHGAYSSAQNELTQIDLVLITHEHQDHLHIDSLKTIIKNNPQAKIITNTSVGAILEKEGIIFTVIENNQKVEIQKVLIEGFGEKHEEIYKELGQVQNTGYFIDNTLFYPGDAFTNPQKSVPILAVPVVAPWATFKRAMEYVLEIQPKHCFPVHDGMLVAGREGPIYRFPPMLLENTETIFIPMREGESHTFI